MNSTDIATIFLNNGLRVRRYTDQATRIFKLIPGDVGRPLADIVNQLDYPGLQKDIKAVLDTLIFSEKEISGRNASWYLVKILPYRTQDNVIDGVVINFIDISAAKKLEAELRAVKGAASST
ncbi:MAG: PAS domain-containing protein [Candidatus Dechloromonas phosphoritropha]